MSSLIAHIAGKHGLSKENLATELLVYILECSDDSIALALLTYYGLGGQGNSYGYRFEPQRKVADSRGIPDIQIKDEGEILCGIIESKFDARLTSYQPTNYLQRLPDNGLLLFIAPKRRQKYLFDELLDRCRSSGCFRQMTEGDANLTCAVVDGKRLEVTSWDEILDRLTIFQKGSQQPPDVQKKCLSDIEQLARFCDVVDKETFEPLTEEQIRGTGISTVIHQLTWITTELINRCIDRGIVAVMSERVTRNSQNAMRADVDSSQLYYGQNIRFLGAIAWVGFWFKAWEERQTTPLWIEIGAKEPKGGEIARQVQRVKGVDAVIKRADHTWLIPIPIAPGRYKEEVVEDAVRFLSEIKGVENPM